MPELKVGAPVLYTDAKNDPPQHAVITAVGVDDDRDGIENPSKSTDCWLTVFPPAGAPVATPNPVAYDADGGSGTWRWESDTKPRTTRSKAAPKDDDKGASA